MHIFLILVVWTIISIVYCISRIGYDYPSRGFRKYFEYLICPPFVGIVYIIGSIHWLIKKPDIPMVSNGNNTWVNLRIPNHESKKKYYTQIRFTGEKGVDWVVNVSSNEPMVAEMFSDEGYTWNNYPNGDTNEC